MFLQRTAITLTRISFLSRPINASAKRKEKGMGGRGRTGEEGREKKGNKRAPLQEFPLVYSLHTERFKKLPSILPKSPRYATLGFYDCEKGVRRRKCKANFHPFT